MMKPFPIAVLCGFLAKSFAFQLSQTKTLPLTALGVYANGPSYQQDPWTIVTEDVGSRYGPAWGSGYRNPYSSYSNSVPGSMYARDIMGDRGGSRYSPYYSGSTSSNNYLSDTV